MKKKKKKEQNFFKKNDFIQSAKFIASFTAIFSVLYITYPLYVLQIELFYSLIELFFLQLIGFQGSIQLKPELESVWILLPNLTVQISFLCTGLIEFFVLIAAILSSFGIQFRKKLIGIFFAAITVLVFNLIRIFATILLIHNSTFEVADLAHDFFFRASLFIVIVGFYGLWFYYAAGKMKKNKKFRRINSFLSKAEELIT